MVGACAAVALLAGLGAFLFLRRRRRRASAAAAVPAKQVGCSGATWGVPVKLCASRPASPAASAACKRAMQSHAGSSACQQRPLLRLDRLGAIKSHA